MKVIPGRIVWYVLKEGTVRPMMVTGVPNPNQDTETSAVVVNGILFPDGVNDGYEAGSAVVGVWKQAVPFDKGGSVGTWSFPVLATAPVTARPAAAGRGPQRFPQARPRPVARPAVQPRPQAARPAAAPARPAAPPAAPAAAPAATPAAPTITTKS